MGKKLSKQAGKLVCYLLVLGLMVSPGWVGLGAGWGLSPGKARATTEMTSQNYIMEAINFGQEINLYSTEESILPEISGEGPQLSELKSTSVTVTWDTDKSSSSMVQFGFTASYGSIQGQPDELVKAHRVDLVNLTPNRLYHFRVWSEDRVGNDGYSVDETFSTPALPEIANVQITDIGLDSALVTFETNTVTRATVRYGTTSRYGNSQQEPSGSYTTSHTFKLSGLSQGTSYHLRAYAMDKQSEEFNSDNYVFSTLPLPTITDLRVTDIGANTVMVRWTTNSVCDSMVEYFNNSDVRVEGVKKGERQTQGSGERVKTHEIKLSQLLGETTYWFRVASQDAHSNRIESSLQSFTTDRDRVAPVISKVKTESSSLASGDSAKVQVTVTWVTDELSSSQVKYGLGSGEGGAEQVSVEDTTMTTSHFVIIQGLQPSSTYHIRAISRDPTGNTGQSELYTILTPKKRRSLIELIAEKLEETFGWIKKMME